MQGWRVYQEDAHNVIIDFDENKSLFAVYDGHGGSEVAVYTSQHLPEFIKNTEEFKKGNYKQALIDAFMEFDESLIKDEVMAILKNLKKETEGEDSYPATDEDAPEDDGEDNVSNLYEEATMPLSEVISRYRNPAMQRLKESGEKPMSPRLKSKDKKSNLGAGEGSSSAAGSSSSSSTVEAECSSSSKACAPDTKPESSSSSNEVTPSEKAESSSTNTATPSDVCSSSSSEIPTLKTEEKSDEKKPEISNGDDVSSSSAKNGSARVEEKSGSGGVEVKENGDNKEEELEISSSEVKKPFKGKAKDKPAPIVANGDGGVDSSSQSGPVTNGAMGKKQWTSPRTLGTKNLLESTLEDDSSESDEDFKVDEESSDDDDDEVNNSHLPDDDDSEDDDELGEEEEETEEDNSDFDGEGAEGLSREDIQKRMKEAILDPKDVPGMDSGCTAVVVLIVDNQVFIANAGDSRAVLCRDALAKDLSEDHKPEDEKEKERIVKAGGEVTPDGRVNGGLNLSRALGDHSYKQTASLSLKEQMITALPDVETLTLTPADEFIVIACDGIWNSLSSQEVVDFVRERLSDAEKKLSTICEELFDQCLASDSLGDGTGCDNMTCVLVKLNSNSSNGPSATVGSAKRSRDSDASEAHAASTSEDAVEKPPAKKSKTDSPTEPSESAPDSSSTSSVSEVEMKEAAAPAPQV